MEYRLLLILIMVGFAAKGQQKTIQERLGYSKDTKLLIIHADDLGVSHSENMASIAVMTNGIVNSASIMVPCPWFPEIAAYAKANPKADLGLHLTLTSEWKLYKWRPVTPYDQVPSLLDDQGYLNETTEAFLKNAQAADVEKELRSQIERAKQFGIDPTHFDSHMAAAISAPEYLKILLKLGREYKVPVHVGKEFSMIFNYDFTPHLTDQDVVVDKTIMASGADFKKGMDNFYTEQLKSLQPGLTVLLLHAAFDNHEMQGVTVEHIDFGSAWRQQDVNFFTSAKCKKLIKDEKIALITWREVRDKLVR
ncbi:polysaccharide deacetylase family protein [Chryseolinea sp. H1M3-3]|uniref:polysaccharide deacetylase family protein n=1 Tax=Chryseolinea sp. H1M3-3 TaxID=3034144 RepID=UPI0023EBF124|nr:polysaccharide deacetylase family protein [Chryseolinea sp. H1M3-3]